MTNLCHLSKVKASPRHVSEFTGVISSCPCCSLPAAGLLSAPVVFSRRAADGRGSRCPHHQGDTSGQPRGAQRVSGLGKVLGRLLHRGEMFGNKLTAVIKHPRERFSLLWSHVAQWQCVFFNFPGKLIQLVFLYTNSREPNPELKPPQSCSHCCQIVLNLHMEED